MKRGFCAFTAYVGSQTNECWLNAMKEFNVINDPETNWAVRIDNLTSKWVAVGQRAMFIALADVVEIPFTADDPHDSWEWRG